MKTSEIKFKVDLDHQNVPQSIKWLATDSQHQELKDCKSMQISLWDAIEKTTYNIHLWTKDITTDEMHAQFFQTLLSFADSYQRATGNPFVKEEIKKFANDLAAKTAEWEESRVNAKP